MMTLNALLARRTPVEDFMADHGSGKPSSNFARTRK